MKQTDREKQTDTTKPIAKKASRKSDTKKKRLYFVAKIN